MADCWPQPSDPTVYRRRLSYSGHRCSSLKRHLCTLCSCLPVHTFTDLKTHLFRITYLTPSMPYSEAHCLGHSNLGNEALDLQACG